MQHNTFVVLTHAIKDLQNIIKNMRDKQRLRYIIQGHKMFFFAVAQQQLDYSGFIPEIFGFSIFWTSKD